MKKSLLQLNWPNHYIDKTDKDHLSVISAVKLISTPFDEVKKAQDMYKKYFYDPESKYYLMTPEAIIKSWLDNMDLAAHYGSLMDEYIGYSLNEDFESRERFIIENNVESDERIKNTCEAYETFIRDIEEKYPDIEFVCREQPVAFPMTEKFFFNGRFDALFYIPRKKQYLLVDWKCAKDLSNDLLKTYRYLLGPMSDYADNSLNKYIMQTMIYRRILEEYILTDLKDPWNYSIINIVVNLGQQSLSGNKPYQIYGSTIPYDKKLIDESLNYIKDKFYETNQTIL